MASFISTFSVKASKKFLLLVSLTAILSLAAIRFYSTHINPEVTFWNDAYNQKLRWKQSFSSLQQNINQPTYWFVGGSSCAFSIRPEILLDEFDIKAVNLGMPAAAGKLFHISLGFHNAKRGDVLVLALEPDLIRDPNIHPTSLAVQLSVKLGKSTLAFGGLMGVNETSLFEEWPYCRPGGDHVVTLLGKLILGRPMYRYTKEDIHHDGWLSTKALSKERPSISVPQDYSIPSPSVDFLKLVKAQSEALGIQLVYLIPWRLVEPSALKGWRQQNTHFLEDISKFIVIVPDQYEGAIADAHLFSDSNWHLNAQGAILKTRSFGNFVSKKISLQVPQ